MNICLVDHHDSAVRARLTDLLAPHEAHTLFILGSLPKDDPRIHVYVAARGGEWLGAAAYFERHKSFVPFSTDAEVCRALVRHIAPLHPDIQ